MNIKDKLTTWFPMGAYQTNEKLTSQESTLIPAAQLPTTSAPASNPASLSAQTKVNDIRTALPPGVGNSSHSYYTDRVTPTVTDSQSVRFANLRPWTVTTTLYGDSHELTQVYPAGFRHGTMALADALRYPAAVLGSLTNDSRLIGFRPEKALFLDIEATGLSHGAGTYAFLVGLGEYAGSGDFHTHQLVLNDPSNESATLARLVEYLDRFEYIVSFNGKSYDLSVLQNRLVMHRFYSSRDVQIKVTPHLDLVHVFRAIWKRALPDCRLQTLEKLTLGFHRQEDIPGELVPTLYFHYLHEMDARSLLPILQHNSYDVLSMAGLVVKLLQAIAKPESIDVPEALAGLAILYARRNDNQTGLSIGLRALDLGLSGKVLQDTLRMIVACCKRLNDVQQLTTALNLFCQYCPMDPEPWILFASYHERSTKDIIRAHEYTTHALGLIQSHQVSERKEIEQRLDRLSRKLKTG